MYRIDNALAATALPAVLPPGPVRPGYFQSGNPSTGQKATTVDRDWANHVQEEIATVIERAGLTLSKTDMTQLWQAIRSTSFWKLTANLDLYVNPTSGSDFNDGLTAGTAFQTLSHAWAYIQGSLDLNVFYTVTVHLANGTYQALYAACPLNGPAVVFLGNTTTPGSVIIDNPTGPAIAAVNGANINVSGVRVIAGSMGSDYVVGGVGLAAANGGQIHFDHVDFGACTIAHIEASYGGIIGLTGASVPLSISGASPYFIVAANSGNASIIDGVCTVTGTPAFSSSFAAAEFAGIVMAQGATFTGTATGTRYYASMNGVINVGLAGNPGFAFPGSVAGALATGGQYA